MLSLPEIRTSARAYKYMTETRRIMPGRSSSMSGLPFYGFGLRQVLVLHRFRPVFLEHADLAIRLEGGLFYLPRVIHSHQPQFREQLLFTQSLFRQVLALDLAVFYNHGGRRARQPVDKGTLEACP